MDASSIIAQVSREDEQLNSYPPEKGTQPLNENVQSSDFQSPQPQKKSTRGFLRSLLCCLGRRKSKNESTEQCVDGSQFTPSDRVSFLLPPARQQVYVLKRPHVDEFLKRMGELYECVLFTASLAKYADPVADLLDQWGVFRARLFRESCVYYRGNYVKDLNKLGRDLQQIVIVDNSPASYIFHPDNAVPVASWFDDMHDNELLDLIPFFEKLAKMDNVYTVLCNSNRPYNNSSVLQINGPNSTTTINTQQNKQISPTTT